MIDGAMAFGYQNTNPPPSDDHWLTPFWKIGRQQADLEARAAANQASAPEGWKLVPIEPVDEMQIPSYLPNVDWPTRRRIYRDMVAAAPQPAQADAWVGLTDDHMRELKNLSTDPRLYQSEVEAIRMAVALLAGANHAE